ncbi:uncharacterized protein DUF397 [Tamaricihabitans halophyticus]|uniref:Uncharacterized protein DUF397 n=1 Tax=Tamaricihabitans halophyticus TaxID=1262583 RepID=A0A4R2QWW5_9PSEU|nr:DUF397 domain-containing protein [Tamaricihabitans halophyticus]TCP53448.1 uncharacterized protein DUF397 [Tamaricihabitans halophyticus]
MTVPQSGGQWRKSSYSANTENCVEIRTRRDADIRDSKNPDAGRITVPRSALTAFVDALK